VERKPYPRAVRLYAVAVDHWVLVDGSFPDLNLAQLPSYKFLNVVHKWALERIDPEKHPEWEAMMDEPLPWQINRGPSQEQLEREGEDFMAFMNQVNGG
jgi:hypothetical protein